MARAPVYLYAARDARSCRTREAGVVIGTVIGSRALGRIPDVWFRRVLALMLAILGVAMLLRAR
jgi:uncharacterized membrane protein YfcA